MTVKVGMSYSKSRPVNAGAPQGSVLGTYVFNIATDDLEEQQEEEVYVPSEGDLAFLETEADTTNIQSTPNKAIRPDNHLSPVLQDSRQQTVLLPTARNVPEKLRRRVEPTWREKPITVRKFVEDNLQTDKLNMQASETYIENGSIFKNPRAIRSESMFRHIATKAKTKGLQVNSAKTCLLVVSASKSYDAYAHMYDEENNKILCQNNMKALGFIFNRRGDASSQVDSLCRKFRQKVWALRRLRKSGFSETELLSVYKTYLRPSLEYSSPIYHSMLTSEQDILLERQQFFALKSIYGFAYSHNHLLKLRHANTQREERTGNTQVRAENGRQSKICRMAPYKKKDRKMPGDGRIPGKRR